MGYPGPCTGFEEPIEVLNARGVTTISGTDAEVTTLFRHRNLAGQGGAQSLKVHSGSSVAVAVNGSGVTHIHIKVLVPDSGDNSIDFDFRLDGVTNVTVRLGESRGLTVIANSDVLARSTRFLSPGWHLLEFEVEADDTGRVRVWVDRSNTEFVDTGPGVDTESDVGSGSGYDQMVIQVEPGGDWFFDDMIIADNVTGRATKEWYIPMVRPTANGATIELDPVGTTNHANVAETGSPDIATYNDTEIPGELDRYQHGAAPWTPQAILAICPVAYVARDGNMTQCRVTILSVATVANGPYTVIGAAGTYGAVDGMIEDDPDTTAPWATIAAVNAVEAGPQFDT